MNVVGLSVGYKIFEKIAIWAVFPMPFVTCKLDIDALHLSYKNDVDVGHVKRHRKRNSIRAYTAKCHVDLRIHLRFALRFGACIDTPTQENAFPACVTCTESQVRSQVKSHGKTQVDTVIR
jgi:hypothetical protein